MRYLLPFLFLILWTQYSLAQLKANFGSNAQEVCIPNLLQLSDSSTTNGAAIVQWEWLNNGAVFSHLQNPALYLNVAGNYTICLRVLDANGNRDTLCRSNYLTAFNSPSGSFSILQTNGCNPLTVDFSSNIQPVNAQIKQYRWDFGDGNIDTLQASPTHVYTTDGNFDVTLIFIDSNGCQDAQLQSNAVTVHPSVTADIALSSYQSQCGLPASVGFTGIGNTQGLTYNWNFGDNGSATGKSVTHNYTSLGCFWPILTVSNAWCSATATTSSCIMISDAPTASFKMDDNIHCSVPFSVQFTNQSTNATKYSWDFGDSTYTTAKTPSHSYSSISAADTAYKQGLIPVILVASNAAGCVARDTQYIHGSLPQTQILSENITCAPDTAYYSSFFRNGSSYASPVSFQWTLDNAVFVTGPTAAAAYPDSGAYNVSLIVTDQLGCKDSSSIVKKIGITPTIDSVTTDTNYVCRLTDIDFVAYGGSYIDSWSWKFSDSSIDIGASINHVFNDSGFITGTVTAGFRGCLATMPLDYYYIYPPIALFSIKDTCNSLLVDFVDKSIGADSWFWDFGDTTTTMDTSSLQYPTYTYPAAGTYSVKLVVHNDSTTCVDTFTNKVILSAPVADFEIPDSLCTISEITPINNSSNATSYIWQATGVKKLNKTAHAPLLRYETAGIYTVLLTAYTDNDCTDIQSKTIHVAGIDSNITRAPIPTCKATLVNFADSSQGILSPIVSWKWGNGSTRSTTMSSYSFPGDQAMNLQVTNDWGCTFDLVDSFPVGGLFVLYNTDKNICLGTSSEFKVRTLNSNKNAFSPFVYYWDFGDGTRDTTTSLKVTHLYDNAGVYSICLEVQDSLGCISTLCHPDWITVHDPTTVFKADSLVSSCPPLEVKFSNLSASGTSWSWSFGDGSVSSLENPTHIYSTAGFYDVILSVEAFPGCSDTDTILQMIQITGPTGNFSSPSGKHCAPHNIELTANGTNASRYTWLFGNGDFQVHAGGNNDTSFYTYTSSGLFVPTVVLDDGIGCQISIEGDTIEILATPVASFRAEPLTCGVDSVRYLLDTFSTDWDASFWSFPQGQPNSSTQPAPWVHYTTTISAQAQLIVVDEGCADTLTKTDLVRLQPPPIAAFDISYNDSCVPARIQFTDRSTSLNQDSIQFWQWDFGNGQSANQADTSLQFNNANNFQIQLVVSDSNNCSDTVIQSIRLYAPPNLALSAPSNSCVGDTVPLQAISTGVVVWQSIFWLSDSTNFNPLTRLDSQQQYFVVSTNSFGCQTTDSLLVVPNPYLLANIADSNQLCLGDSLTLQANSNGLGLQWRSMAFLPCTNCSNPTVAPNQNTWYYVQVDSVSACVVWDSILIEVLPLPNAQVLGDTSFCLGDSLLLQAAGGLLYRWSPSSVISNDSGAQVWVTPTTATTFSLWLQDSSGCIDSTQHHVAVRSTSKSPLNGTTICLGDSVTLQLSSGSAPTWQGQNLSCQTCATPTATPTDSTWYNVQYINIDNCPVSDSVPIQVIDTRFFQTLPLPVDSLCKGDTVQLSVQGANAPVTWWPASYLSDPSTPNPLCWPLQNMQYKVRLTQGNCSVVDSVLVTLRSATSIQTQDITYCMGDSAQLFATGNANSYQWQPVNNLSNPNSANPWVNNNSNQSYQVIGQGRCNTDTAFANVNVHTLPNLQVDSVITAQLGQTITLEANSDAADIFWSPAAGLSCDNCWQTEWTADSSRLFYITAIDAQGCLRVDSILIVLQSNCVPDLVYVPNAFSPDGDGQNDVLYAQTNSVQTLLGFQIYNRWGELVFETRDFSQGWDGRYQGQAATADVYGYVLQFECPQSGEVLLKKGSITILR